MKSKKNNYINAVNLNMNKEFPYLVLNVINENSYPQGNGFRVMHWHKDLQFIYVLEGSIKVKTLDSTVKVNEGEAIFINTNVVHYVKSINHCHYNSFVFPEKFLTFYTGCPAKNLVEYITQYEKLCIYHFGKNINWCNEILAILHQLTIIEKSKPEFYVYEVLARLTSIWLVMLKNIPLPPKQPKNIVNLRMQKILLYIERHYEEDISLENISRSANISKSECLRCFKISMQTTPYKYLLEYRLSKAAEFLMNTDEPVGRIAAKTGFNQMSYFGKCFKMKTGYSPRKYRQINNKNIDK